jgi:transcriptional regulatory protein RtcR
MKSPKPLVVFGMLGPKLDSGDGKARWNRWRPSVALGQNPEFQISRFELLFDPKFTSLAKIIGEDFIHVSPATAVQQHKVPMKDPWDFEEVYTALFDFAAHYDFKPEREDYLLNLTTGTHVVQICLFLLAQSRHWPARLIQTSPPNQRQREVYGSASIIDLDLSKYDRLVSRFRVEATNAQSFLKQGIATKNAAYNKLIDNIESVATASKSPLLLTGPTGSGKSQLASRIFELKKNRNQIEGEFVEVNCATLRGDQAMSSLFGHTKGAYTGSAGARAGLLMKANKGLLFLDEIGELGLDEQAMLLKALESKAFYPVGSDELVRSDFQLIAGTNQNLAQGVSDRRFRDDLLARIDGWTFALPSLVERPEDLEPNLDFEIARQSESMGVRITWAPKAKEKYLNFAHQKSSLWTRNFRDLSSSVMRLATLASQGTIGVELVAEETHRLQTTWQKTENSTPMANLVSEVLGPRAAALDLFDAQQLGEVLQVCRTHHSLSEAGRALFGVSRTKRSSQNDADRLRKYLGKFDIAFADVKGKEG